MGRRVSCCSGSTHAWFLRADNRDPGHMIQVPNHLHRGVHRVKHLGTTAQFKHSSPVCRVLQQKHLEQEGAAGDRRPSLPEWRPLKSTPGFDACGRKPGPECCTTLSSSQVSRTCVRTHKNATEEFQKQPASHSTSTSQPSELQLRDMKGWFHLSSLH